MEQSSIFSKSEEAVIPLFVEGESIAEIATAIQRSKRTVEWHLMGIYKKLRNQYRVPVKHRLDAVRLLERYQREQAEVRLSDEPVTDSIDA